MSPNGLEQNTTTVDGTCGRPLCQCPVRVPVRGKLVFTQIRAHEGLLERSGRWLDERTVDRLSLEAICEQLGHPEDATFTSLLEPVPTDEG